MVEAKRQGREKPTKIEQRKVKGRSEDRSEDLRRNKQHSWLAQFTAARPTGEEKKKKKHIKRGAKGPSLSLLLVPVFSLSSLRIFGSPFPHASRMYFPAIF